MQYFSSIAAPLNEFIQNYTAVGVCQEGKYHMLHQYPVSAEGFFFLSESDFSLQWFFIKGTSRDLDCQLVAHIAVTR